MLARLAFCCLGGRFAALLRRLLPGAILTTPLCADSRIRRQSQRSWCVLSTVLFRKSKAHASQSSTGKRGTKNDALLPAVVGERLRDGCAVAQASVCGRRTDVCSPLTAKDFIRKLLTVDEDERPTAAEALEHPVRRSASPLQPVNDFAANPPTLTLNVQWLRVALSRPPSPSGYLAAPSAQPESHPDEHHLGPSLSRTDTITDHAPVIEKRSTFSSERGDHAVV